MTNLDSMFKSRDSTLPTKAHPVKAMVLPVVMYGCESWTIKKAECWRIDAFELCWRRLLRVPWTARRSNHAVLKEISNKHLNIHWKDWCWSWNSNTLTTWFEELTHWKRPWCWERLKTGGEGADRGWGTISSSETWFWGISLLWPPFPGEAIKLLFSTSSKILSLRINTGLGTEAWSGSHLSSENWPFVHFLFTLAANC